MPVVDPCNLCGKSRGVVMIGEEESGILICPHCDYANPSHAGPPIDPTLLRRPEATS